MENPNCNRNCAGCPNNKKQDNTMIVVAVIVAVIVLAIIFLATLLCIVLIVVWKDQSAQNVSGTYTTPYTAESYDSGSQGENLLPNDSNEPNVSNAPNASGDQEDASKEPKLPKKENSGYYGEIEDAVRTDLNYSVEWENYKFDKNSDTIHIEIDYPVIKGDVPNKDVLNEAIARETQYFSDYFKEYSQYMITGEIFNAYSRGFVTYMDAGTMSVVFCEEIETDYWSDCALYCINIDMSNGVIIENSSIVKVDNDFTVDFRIKSREQNGTVNALDNMNDQEISYYLTNAGTFIVFYTPLGMEVGLNYGENYVTVTYKEYEKYLQKY